MLKVLAIAAEVAELTLAARGAERAGGSRRGALLAIAGGGVGAVVGSFVIPILIVDTVIGGALGSAAGAPVGDRAAAGIRRNESAVDTRSTQMRSPEEDQLLRDVMQRLDAFPEVPTTKDLEEIVRLLDASRHVPLSDDEAVSVVGKLHALHHDTESITFRHAAGRHLAEAREAAGLTRQQAADHLRLTEAELRMIEAGEQPLGLLEAARLANLYEISLDDLADELV